MCRAFAVGRAVTNNKSRRAGKRSQKTSHEVSAFKCSAWQSQKEIDFSNKTKKAIAEIDA